MQMAHLQSIREDAAVKRTAEEDFLAGIEKLEAAESTGFQDKKVLMEIYNHFNAAVKKQKQEIKYLNTMAYFLILIGSHKNALTYLATTLKIEPKNESALKLQQTIQDMLHMSPEKKQQFKVEAFVSRPYPKSTDDFDDLYEELSDFIDQQTRYFMQSMVSPEVTLEPEKIEPQERMFEELSNIKDIILEKFEILENEVDLTPLWTTLKQLEQLYNRFYDALRYNAFFQVIMDGIEEARQATLGIFESIKDKSFEEIESLDTSSQINSVYDICDEIADQLDRLSQETDIFLIEREYEGLVNFVQSLQDTLDDL